MARTAWVFVAEHAPTPARSPSRPSAAPPTRSTSPRSSSPTGPPAPPSTPNACAGRGVFGDDATEDRTTALRFRDPRLPPGARPGRPPRRGRVGRRRAGAADARGDRAGAARGAARRPREHARRRGSAAAGESTVFLGGATTSPEDPAVPSCPSLSGRVAAGDAAPASGAYTVHRPRRAGGRAERLRRARPQALRSCSAASTATGPARSCCPSALRTRAPALGPRWGPTGRRPSPRRSLTFRRSLRGDAESGGGCLPPATGSTRVARRPGASSRRASRLLEPHAVVRAGAARRCAARSARRASSCAARAASRYARGDVPLAARVAASSCCCRASAACGAGSTGCASRPAASRASAAASRPPSCSGCDEATRPRSTSPAASSSPPAHRSAGALAAVPPDVWAARLLARRARVGPGAFLDGVATGEPGRERRHVLVAPGRRARPRSGARLVVARDLGAAARRRHRDRADRAGRRRHAEGARRRPAAGHGVLLRVGVRDRRLRRSAAPAPRPTRRRAEPLRMAFSSCQHCAERLLRRAPARRRPDRPRPLPLPRRLRLRARRRAGRPRATRSTPSTCAPTGASTRSTARDPALRELHRLHPTAHVWDDHEVFNNYTEQRPAAGAPRSAPPPTAPRSSGCRG